MLLSFDGDVMTKPTARLFLCLIVSAIATIGLTSATKWTSKVALAAKDSQKSELSSGPQKSSAPSVSAAKRLKPQREPVRAMDLLRDGAGWVLLEKHLLWTNTAGKQWRDITPPETGPFSIDTAFFLDASTGWALISGPDPDGKDAISLKLASTTDAGTTWSINLLRPTEGVSAFYAGTVNIDFVDPLHGWIMLRLSSSANFSRGALLTTSNGGSSWSELAEPPIGNPVKFVTAEEGWLAGGPNGDELYWTQNGGETWKPRFVVAPATVHKNVQRVHELPTFENQKDGILPVSFFDSQGVTKVFYRTQNGGESWEPGTMSTSAETDAFIASSVVDSNTVVVAPSSRAELGTLEEGRRERTRNLAGIVTGDSPFTKIDFVTQAKGWLLLNFGKCVGPKIDCSQESKLFVTTDGAQNLTEITPNVGPAETGKTEDALSSLDDLSLEISPSASIQNKEGFDKCAVASVAQMQVWLSASPYKAAGVYIGGENHSCKTQSISASWMSNVLSMGWGVIPTWVGPQAPSVFGNCQTTCSKMSTNATTAESQGVAEANKAADQAAAYGLQGTIIYYDMEAYDSNASGTVVKAFMNGWVRRLRERGFDGAGYSSRLNVSDWVNIANPPAAIWFTWFFQNGVPCGDSCHTVFGVPGISDSVWFNHQRLRQTSSGFSRCWSSTCLTIDEDWLDGPVAGGSAQPGPTPTLTVRSVSSTNVQVNQPFTVSTTLSVSNGTADHAGISISFPSLTSSGVSGTPPNETYNSAQGTVTTASSSSITGSSTLQYFGAGETLTCSPSSACSAQHLLVEGDWVTVGASNTRSLNLTVTPKVVGTFKVRIRGWATAPGYQNPSRDPSSGSTDQQGFSVYELTVTVSSTPTDSTGPNLSITSHSNGDTVSNSTIDLFGTASDSGKGNNGISSVTVNGVAASGGTASGSGTANWSRSLTLNQGANNITVVARDNSSSQNPTTQSITVNYQPTDSTGPNLSINSHSNGQVVSNSTIDLFGTASDSGKGNNGISSVTVNGIAASGGTASGSNTANWSRSLTLNQGANNITVLARDNSSSQNPTTQTITVTYQPTDSTGPNLSINSHSNGQVVSTSTIDLFGTASDSGKGNNGISSVTVNGVAASGGTASGSSTANWSRSLTLNQGANNITVMARDNSSSQNPTTQSITVNYQPVENLTITVSASPGAGGTVSGGGTFAAGSSRTVTATANSNYSFTSWTENGNVVSSSSSYNFILNSNRNLVANFTNIGGNAVYDSILMAPKCGQPGSACDAGALLNGRDTLANGPEPNQPNTINNSCLDGTNGDYHSDESLDRIKVSTLDGSGFAPGKTVRIEATVWAWTDPSLDFLDLYYAGDANNPNWIPIATLQPSVVGSQVLTTTYTLPSGGSLQAVRGVFRFQGVASSCGSNSAFDDYDDLIFAVNAGGTPGTNFARSTNGGIASASSTAPNAGFPGYNFLPSTTNNGDRRGGMSFWRDDTANVYPDWLQVDFNGTKSITEIDVFTAQDNDQNTVEPTQATTFSLYGITAFDVQYWTGSAWITVPNGSVTGNNKVWRQFSFSPITTSKIRVLVNNALNSRSRITEVEAWGTAISSNQALAANGGIASASSTTPNSQFPGYNFLPGVTIDGDRRGGTKFWRDDTANAYPDWLQVDFNGSKSISEIDVLTVQDSDLNTVDPTLAMTFSLNGITAFDVQYWTGSAWATVPNGSVAGNSNVWRQFVFSPITTSKVRVLVNNALNARSRIVELEAWGTAVVNSGNQALAANGGIAGASSTTPNSQFPGYNFLPSTTNDGDRRGGTNFWRDDTANVYPDWLQVDFSGSKTITEVDVFTAQDNDQNTVEPTQATTFSLYGITTFDVQYWTGSAWITVPNGSVTGNNKVWRQFTFSPITTSKIRVLVNNALNSRSRIVEVEAY
jgi:hypothetical protein